MGGHTLGQKSRSMPNSTQISAALLVVTAIVLLTSAPQGHPRWAEMDAHRLALPWGARALLLCVLATLAVLATSAVEYAGDVANWPIVAAASSALLFARGARRYPSGIERATRPPRELVKPMSTAWTETPDNTVRVCELDGGGLLVIHQQQGRLATRFFRAGDGKGAQSWLLGLAATRQIRVVYARQ